MVKVVPSGEAGARRGWEGEYSAPESESKMLRTVSGHLPLIYPLLGLGRLLETGIGSGMLSGFLARAGSLVTALELSPGVMKTARTFYASVGVTVQAAQGDGMDMPFPSDSFDAVFSQGLWEHFSDDSIRRFAQEALRVAPVVYASVPSRYYPHVGRRGPGLVGNERLMSPDQWSAILGPIEGRAKVAYYTDWKVLTLMAKTLPYPMHILIEIKRS